MKGIRIRPDKRGMRSSLFDLEADIMEVIWSKGWDRFAVSDIHRELEASRTIAYTTVMTTVSRLFDKELLDRQREGRRYLYTCRMDRDEFLRTMAREVMESLPGVGREQAIALLVERVAEADADDLEQLESLIKARREALNS